MTGLGLDVPFTAKLAQKLRERNIIIDCDYTLEDFVAKTLSYAQSKGVGMRLSGGGGEDA